MQYNLLKIYRTSHKTLGIIAARSAASRGMKGVFLRPENSFLQKIIAVHIILNYYKYSIFKYFGSPVNYCRPALTAAGLITEQF